MAGDGSGLLFLNEPLAQNRQIFGVLTTKEFRKKRKKGKRKKREKEEEKDEKQKRVY